MKLFDKWFKKQPEKSTPQPVAEIKPKASPSQKQKTAADRMALALELVYWAKGIYINYRENFIAVKIDKAQVKDRKNLQLLEAEYTGLGYKKVVTNQGVTYRIPKA